MDLAVYSYRHRYGNVICYNNVSPYSWVRFPVGGRQGPLTVLVTLVPVQFPHHIIHLQIMLTPHIYEMQVTLVEGFINGKFCIPE